METNKILEILNKLEDIHCCLKCDYEAFNDLSVVEALTFIDETLNEKLSEIGNCLCSIKEQLEILNEKGAK